MMDGTIPARWPAQRWHLDAPQIYERRAWYALAAEPRKERLAIHQLWKLGVEVFWPHYLAGVRRRSGNNITRRAYELRSWFPPYMFVADGPAFSVGAISGLMGVSSFVYAGSEHPVEIPIEVLLEIRSLGDPTGLIPEARVGPPNMIQVRGENFADCLRRLGGMKARVWAQGMSATVRT